MAHETATVSEVRRERYARRLPTDLSALRGPDRGRVRLPLHLAWSGLTEYDLDRPRLRMSCYRVVLAEGGRDDLVRHLNRDLLVELWPVLRTLVSKDLRVVWEDAFHELAPMATAAGRPG
ncbi:transcriptional regulator [Streptomyces sp. NPDC085460]|uniref:transcriptional regulator n=1 Tax=unclassified Streptomyces TaxID=2593676 RepID=UPI0037D4BD4C